MYAKYYPVEGTPRNLGSNQGLVASHPNQMFFEEELDHQDLFYHTWEKNIMSGVGVFGVPLEKDDEAKPCFIGVLAD